MKSIQLHKKIRDPLSGVPFMGEEKPDEELMGKRKLAPRLSTDTFDVDNVRMSGLTAEYTSCAKKCFEGLGTKAGMDKFFI